MALNKGAYPFPFGAGIDTKSGKQAGNKLLQLENGWFLKGGEISKRWGFVSKGIPGGGPATGNSLLTLDDELAAAVGGSLYSYDSENGAWDSKGTLRTVGVTAKSIVQSSSNQLYADVASLNGITVYAYESAGSVYMVVVDEASGAVLATSNLGAGGTPRCATIQNQIYVLFAKPVSGGVQQVFYVHITTSNPTSITSPLYNSVDLDATAPYFSTVSVPNAIYVLYVKKPGSGPTNVVVRNLFSGVDNIFLGSTTASALDICAGPDGNLYCAAAVGASVLYGVFAPSLTPLFAAVSVATGSPTATKNIAIAAPTSGNADVFFEKAPVGGTPTTNQSVWTFAFTSAGTNGAVSLVARSVGLGSRAVAPGSIPRVGALASTVALVYDSPLQATYFLYTKGSGIVARFLSGAAAGLSAKPFLSSIISIGGTQFAAALGSKGPLQSLPSNVLTTAKTISRVTFDFDQRYRNIQLGRTALIAGGQVSQYDGTSVVEDGFNVFPEQPTVTTSPAASFSLIQAGGAGGSPQLVVQINVPADSIGHSSGGSALAAGAMYTPGSYILLPWGGDNSGGGDWYVWFSVDGVGSDPAITANGVQIPLLSTDKQSIVASKLAVGIGSISFFTTTAATDSVTVTTVPLSSASPGDKLNIPAPPMEWTRFGIWKVNAANEASASAGYMIGDAELGSGGEFRFVSGETRVFVIDGGSPQSITYDSTCVDPASTATFINAHVTGVTASVNSEAFSVYDGQLKVASNSTGASSSVAVTPGATYVHDGLDPFAHPVSVAGIAAAQNSEMYRLTCVSGSRIKSGQYFSYTSSRSPHSQAKLKYVFYFVVDSVVPATVPTLPDSVASVSVAILSTDTAGQVATKLSAAMLAVTYTDTSDLGPVTISPFAAGYVMGPAVVMASAASTGSFAGSAKQAFTTAEAPLNYSVGGELEAGQRAYYAVYRWVDAKGLLCRSAPSIAAVSVSAEGNCSNLVTVPTLRLTAKSGAQIEVYRTAADVDTAQLVTTLANDPTVDSLSYWDSTSDVALASAEFMYTTGGILPNTCPPPASSICEHQDRAFLFGLDDQNSLRYSKKYVDGTAVEFSDVLQLRFDDEGGPLVAGKTMDDKLIIFKKRRIYFLAGDGPNALGQQDSFTDPRVINSGVGCISPESIVFTPMGLMFQSERGLHLLTRDLQTLDIGSNVDDFVTSTVTSAVLVPKATRIQFAFASGNLVFLDYYFNQWGTAVNHDAQAGVIWNDLYALMKTDGSIWIESPGTYSDAGAAYSLKIQTPWFKPAGLQGFFRCQKFLFLGTLQGPHILKVDVEYDYADGAIWRTYYFDPAKISDGLQMDVGQSLGTTDGASGAYQFMAQLDRQKCESIRLTISEAKGTQGYVVGDSPSDFTSSPGLTRIFVVDGGAPQTITFAAGDVGAVGFANAINAQISGARARAINNALVVTSNTTGSSSSVSIPFPNGTLDQSVDGFDERAGVPGIDLPPGDSFTIADLTFGIAVKDSTYRFPAARRIG